MANTEPRLPEQYVSAPAHIVADFHLSEFTADMAGSLSPFGQDVQFPLPSWTRSTTRTPARRIVRTLADGR